MWTERFGNIRSKRNFVDLTGNYDRKKRVVWNMRIRHGNKRAKQRKVWSTNPDLIKMIANHSTEGKLQVQKLREIAFEINRKNRSPLAKANSHIAL